MSPWQYFKYKIFKDEGGWIPIAIAAGAALGKINYLMIHKYKSYFLHAKRKRE